MTPAFDALLAEAMEEAEANPFGSSCLLRLGAIVVVFRDALLATPCSCQKKGDRILYGDGYQGYRDVKEDVTCDIHAAIRRAEEIAGAQP